MNTETFIQGVYRHLLAGVEEQIEFIQSPPPGRKPRQRDVAMHRWFSSLSDENKDMVAQVIRESYEEAIYGILMVLDHKMFVEGYGKKGELELYYRAPSGEQVHLNPLGGANGKDLEYYFKSIRDSEP